jgi:hypothetical protein
LLNNTKITHSYSNDGQYTVTLRLYDAGASPEKLWGAATATAKIGVTLGRLQNVIMSLPGGDAMYGLDIEAGWDDSVALTTDEIILYVRPRFAPSSGAAVANDIPCDYAIYVDGNPAKNGVVTLEPASDHKKADGYEDVNIGRLSKGKHTIRLILDPGLKITDPSGTNKDMNRIIDHEISVVDSYL